MAPVKRKREKPTEEKERVSETGASEREETYETSQVEVSVGHEEERYKNEQNKEQQEDKEDDEADKDEETREETENDNEKFAERDEEEGDEGGEEDAKTEKDPNRPSIDEVVKSFSIENYSVRMTLNGNNDLSGDIVVKSRMGKGFDKFRGILWQ
ncbi:uncharacterized protein LOC132619993 [Lycium barbarum]|uniref:uncharacterized protein LOC132619993 n=1 Tax=Lycium barbarum TaxID=112863 RepID=UPI00293EE83C|nr:uncharacterized protein LOC132619993 [Lycium barbarum]